MKISNHVIQDVEMRPSPNSGGIITPRLVVIHYTGDNSLEGALDWLTTPESQVSAHLLNGKAGELYQLVPFNVRAWHAGRSEWNDQPNVNGFSIGIENVGYGDSWPGAQIAKLMDILEALVAAYAIEGIVGHEDICIPDGRKQDPGPNFPWSMVAAKWPKLVGA